MRIVLVPWIPQKFKTIQLVIHYVKFKLIDSLPRPNIYSKYSLIYRKHLLKNKIRKRIITNYKTLKNQYHQYPTKFRKKKSIIFYHKREAQKNILRLHILPSCVSILPFLFHSTLKKKSSPKNCTTFIIQQILSVTKFEIFLFFFLQNIQTTIKTKPCSSVQVRKKSIHFLSSF